MKQIVFLVLLVAQCSLAQVNFTIVNASTKEPLVNIPVRFGKKTESILMLKEKLRFLKNLKLQI